ncbi:peptide chain release factor N(5)-glutamine methyltransferase [Temperatibacter marinus]|uniref:Release factor glutamine methyltransferase n=1 Tax=Temperatibacter marinus TaxID=1456591 RepID=A0AA52EAQ1_9PROT|nr:peptide chain release factor N(5)-glutamine methyltransferase [Temperatibacter marinus]WND01381.1 peptide chain release factor N(5)-glutamine methyltransferase [Temperatibacter marinus]
MPSVRGLLSSGVQTLENSGSHTAQLDAEYLLAHVLDLKKRASLYLYEEALTEKETALFQQLIDRRVTHEPVAYIIGTAEFWSLTFHVNEDTLIPRADSETVVDHVLSELKKDTAPRILDLGTGSGCLLLSILSEIPMAYGVGLDIHRGALEFARKNAVLLQLEQRTFFQESDWFNALDETIEAFDCIISNPPYIPSQDCMQLMPDVKDFEPLRALDGGKDGLRDYRVVIDKAPSWLKYGGILVFECGIGQAEEIQRLMTSAGYVDVRCVKDLPGVDRVISGKYFNNS